MRDALGDGADGGGAAGLGKAALEIDEFAVDRDETELRLHARERFIEIDRLRDVIHRADAEPLDFALLGGAGGDEDDRD